MQSKAKTKTAGKSAQNNNPQRPALPNWPSLTPLLPAEDLSVHTLLTDQVLTISKFWSSALCAKYIAFLRTLPLTTTPGIPKKGNAVRVNDRYQIDDPAFAERLWTETALRSLVESAAKNYDAPNLWGGEVLGLNPSIRIYRYTPGQFFDQHYDESTNLLFGPDKVPAKTTWTLLLYLSSRATGCVGGETVFYPEPVSKKAAMPDPVVAELEVGMALLHRHGRECLLHEGREVLEGEKWVIRSDLVVKR